MLTNLLSKLMSVWSYLSKPGEIWGDIIQEADGLRTDQWYIVMGVVVVAGMLCMRGFGSRKDY